MRTKSSPGKVFLVHGRDDAARETVARFLERLGLEAVILHAQATRGRTFIEKLEHYSGADCAVVLLTPDDVGALKTDAAKLQPRARQNVVLELGYFVALLGRDHVCALHPETLWSCQATTSASDTCGCIRPAVGR
jgi:predicted nucleotide-binding protein